MVKIRKHVNSVHEYCTLPFECHANRLAWETKHGQQPSGAWCPYITDHNPDHWFGAPSATHAANRVTEGWPEGAEKVFANLADLDVAIPASIRRKTVRAEQGDELDIHTVYRGDLNHAWSSRRRKHTRSKKVVRILAQSNLLAAMSVEQLFWRGAAVVKLSDLLTEAGYSVEIIGFTATCMLEGENAEFLVTFPLKEAEEPLNCEKLAGVLCNAGFHRIYGFRAYGALYPSQSGIHSCMTGAADPETNNRLIDRENYSQDGITTFTTPYALKDMEKARAWIQACVSALDKDQPQKLNHKEQHHERETHAWLLR